MNTEIKTGEGQSSPTRLEEALRMSGEGDTHIKETTEVFDANAEAEKQVAARTGGAVTQSMLSRLVSGHGDVSVHDEIQFAMPELTDEAKILGAIVGRRQKDGTIFDPGTGKLSEETLAELAEQGYYGLLVPKEYGGRGLTFSQTGDVIFNMVKNGSFDLGLGVSVDEGIGMVSPLIMYGTEEQKKRYLPDKALGKIKSWFALTESQAGSAVGRIATRFVQDPNDPDTLLVYGHKRFTTGVRLSNDTIKFVGVLIGLDDDNKKRALIVELPEHESDEFKLFNYDLLPISRAWNIGMEFNGLRVPKANLIPKPGMVVPFSLLNRGRYFLLGGAMGTVLKYLKDLVGTKGGDPEDIGWVNFRFVQGHAIGDYEIVQHRLARMLGMAVTLRSLMASMGHEIDAGKLAEIDGLIAKPTASWYTNEAGDLSLTTWGGRGLLADNASGAETQDRRAMKIYEGEDTVLILKLIAMILNDLSETTFGKLFDSVTDALKAVKSKNFAGLASATGKFTWHLPGVAVWMIRKVCRVSYGQPLPDMNPELASHLAFALRVLERKVPLRVAGLFLKYGKNLPKHQAPLFRLGQKVMWSSLMVHTVLWVHHFGNKLEREAALIELANLRRLISNPEPTDRDDARGRWVADMIRAGGSGLLEDVPVATKIPLAYHEPALGSHQPIAAADERIGRHE